MLMFNRILLTSTSEVYGDPLEHPQTESYWGNVNPIGICIFHGFLRFVFYLKKKGKEKKRRKIR